MTDILLSATLVLLVVIAALPIVLLRKTLQRRIDTNMDTLTKKATDKNP